MGEAAAAPADLASVAIWARLGAAMPVPYLGPEGDYLRLVRRAPPPVDISISCCGLPDGRYSVQICLDGDPMAIAFDDECDLDCLVAVCQAYLGD